MATRVVDGVELPAPGTWNADISHSHLEFTVRHLMVGKTRGRFSTWSATAVIAEDPTRSSVTVTIDPASVDTRDANRDGHLRSADFFDVEQFPAWSFVSTAVSGSGASWSVTGDLTIHGVTRSVVLDLAYEGAAKDPWGNQRAAFSGATEIDREDFGLTWNAALEAGGVLVGRTVKIEFEVETVLAQA
jgi:polyisoprenoid-binding protein YceI